jgi:hypothetical protein
VKAVSVTYMLFATLLVTSSASADIVFSTQSGSVYAVASAGGGPASEVDYTVPSGLWGASYPSTTLTSQSNPDPIDEYGPATVTTTVSLQAVTTIPDAGVANFTGNASVGMYAQTTKGSPEYGGLAEEGSAQADLSYQASFVLTTPMYYEFEAYAQPGAEVDWGSVAVTEPPRDSRRLHNLRGLEPWESQSSMHLRCESVR